MRCRGCGCKLLCERKGETTLKASMVKFDAAGQAYARCYASGCGVDTPIVGLTLAAAGPTSSRVHVRRRLDTLPET